MERILIVDFEPHLRTGELVDVLRAKEFDTIWIDELTNEDIEMGSLNNGVRLGRLAFAVALMTGMGGGLAQGTSPEQQAAIGSAMMGAIKYHYRGVGGSRKSGAAAAKRASAKRRNVLKRQSNRR